MLFWLLRSTFTLLVTVAVCAMAVTVPVGRRTLFEHAAAILSTEPARELGEDLLRTGREVGSTVKSAFDAQRTSGEAREEGLQAVGGPNGAARLGNP